MEPNRYGIRGYKMKKRPIGNPDDPVWLAILDMRRTRAKAMKKAMETGERYRDPFEDRFRKQPE
jgi:hypothetical protein